MLHEGGNGPFLAGSTGLLRAAGASRERRGEGRCYKHPGADTCREPGREPPLQDAKAGTRRQQVLERTKHQLVSRELLSWQLQYPICYTSTSAETGGTFTGNTGSRFTSLFSRHVRPITEGL